MRPGAQARFEIVVLPDDRVYWFATLSTLLGGRDADPRSTLRKLFGSWHAPIDELPDATPTEAVLRHDIYDLAAFPRLSARQRGVLLGDAARAMTSDLGQARHRYGFEHDIQNYHTALCRTVPLNRS